MAVFGTLQFCCIRVRWCRGFVWCVARLGEGSLEGSSLALWGCAELMLCNLHFAVRLY